MAFVVVSHQHAGHVSLLPSLLSKRTAMPVVEATDGMNVEANRVYLAPGGTHLAILHGTLHFMESDSQERVPLPIDYFFRSLAEDQKQAVGIILSGTGTDGTLGLRAIKAESGMTITRSAIGQVSGHAARAYRRRGGRWVAGWPDVGVHAYAISRSLCSDASHVA
jgi:two-component system CheB/CheR fusion protein